MMVALVLALSINVVESAETGAITNLTIAGDATGMNWVHVADGSQYPWIGPQYGWGTGTLKVDGKPCAWTRPGRLGCGVEVVRTRRVADGVLEERYAFRNVTDRPLALTEIDVHTPFNDNYPKSSADMFLRRCHAHVWPGGASGWVSAMRIGGGAPHLGLVVIEGSLAAYEQKERAREKGMSNVRGVIALSPADATLAPGAETAIAWTVFAHAGWDDFAAKVVALGGVWATADRYVAKTGEKVTVTARTGDGVVTRDWTCPGPGEHRVEIACGARTAQVEMLGVDDPEALLLARARYIVRHQQINEPGSPYDGALVPYDPNLGKQERRWLPEWQGVINVDHSEGGERMGMGVFLAQMVRRGHEEFRPALDRYAAFVRNRLQEPDYTSWQDVTRPSRKRAFNYPWFIRFYLEMHALTGERRYLEDAFGTLKRLFSGCVFVPDCLVEFPVGRLIAALRAAGMASEAETAVSLVRGYLEPAATFDVAKVVTHEVGIAPEMVSGSFGQLLDFYAATGETRYLAAAEKWRPVLEAVCGRQPSWHTKDIGMHHWDGHWFGRLRHWGDTLPHDWNGHAATAFRSYAAATGDATYAVRAKGVADAMLGLLFPDGRATCAWIYTDRVNGERVKGPDPLMNDQDWACVYYLDQLRAEEDAAKGWQKPQTTRRYLQGPLAERLLVAYREGKVVHGEMCHEKDWLRWKYVCQPACGVWLVHGADDAAYDFKAARLRVDPEGVPIHGQAWRLGDLAVDFEACAPIERKPSAHIRVTLANRGGSTISERIGFIIRNAQEFNLVFGAPDIYGVYNPKVRSWKGLDCAWHREDDAIVFHDLFVSFRGDSEARWDGEAGILRFPVDLKAGETKTYDLVLGRQDSVVRPDYEAVRERVRADWRKELAKAKGLPLLEKCLLVQILQCYARANRGDVILPRQGGLQRWVWPWDQSYAAGALTMLGYGEYVEMACDFYFGEYAQPDGMIGPFGMGWVNDTANVLGIFSRHCAETGNSAFWRKHRAAAERAFRWIRAERAKSAALDGQVAGLFPAGVASDDPKVFQSWGTTDLLNLQGLEHYARAAKRFDDPAADEAVAEAADYRATLAKILDRWRRAAAEKETFSIPYKPDGSDQKLLRDSGYFYAHPAYFALFGFLDANDMLKVRKYMLQEGLANERGLYFHHPAARDPELGDHVWYTTASEYNWFFAWKRVGRDDLARQALDACLRYAVTDEYQVGERFHDASPWYLPWSPNASGAGRILQMLHAGETRTFREKGER